MKNNFLIATFECLKNVSFFLLVPFIPFILLFFYSLEFANIIQKICVIKQAFSVKMTGYWPSSFLHFYLPRPNKGF